MFERFSDDARQAVVRAQEEATALGHNYIGTEHLLLGLAEKDSILSTFGLTREALVRQTLAEIGPGRPADAAALASIGIDLEEVRRRVEDAFGPGALERTRAGRVFCAERRFTPRSKKALELAVKEARRLGHGMSAPSTSCSACSRSRKVSPSSSSRSSAPRRIGSAQPSSRGSGPVPPSQI